jgi:tRNA pseudouridine38-40 synthase
MDQGDRGNGTGRTGKIALIIQYDGTGFNGWQIQNKGRTVQGEIERALGILLKENHRVTASGRTDSGVHAFGQVAHFECKKDIDLKKICIGLNGILDRDVSIKNAYRVNSDFHARFSAVAREYLYLIYNHNQRNPFMNYRAMWVNYKLDVDYLRKTFNFLLGEKDFASFCKKSSSNVNTIRRIEEIEVSLINELIIIRIRGNAFLHNMIRIMIGTIIEMIKDNVRSDFILEILNKSDRVYGGFTAPSYGLYLNNVIYNSPLSVMESAY